MKQQNSVQYEMKSFYQTKCEIYSENINRIKVQSSRFILTMLFSICKRRSGLQNEQNPFVCWFTISEDISIPSTKGHLKTE